MIKIFVGDCVEAAILRVIVILINSSYSSLFLVSCFSSNLNDFGIVLMKLHATLLQHAKAGDAASAAQEFFLNEVQLGEEALASGDMEGCVEHLLAALKVAGNPTQLLQMYQQALPPDVFQMLVQRLPTVVSTKSSGQGAQVRMAAL